MTAEDPADVVRDALNTLRGILRVHVLPADDALDALVAERGVVRASCETLASRLRSESDKWEDGEDIKPLLVESAEEIELLTGRYATAFEALRWIAAGRTGSYGAPALFAGAVLHDFQEEPA